MVSQYFGIKVLHDSESPSDNSKLVCDITGLNKHKKAEKHWPEILILKDCSDIVCFWQSRLELS